VVAKDQNIKIDPEIALNISNKISKIDPDTEGYWPTLGNFVSVRSLGAKGNEKIQDCVDSPPKPSEIPTRMNDSSWSHFQIVPAVYENCRFTLDSERDDKALNALMTQKGSPLIAFKHCLISYNGGEVNLILAWSSTPMNASFVNRETGQVSEGPLNVSGRAIQFVDCQFDFSIRNIPPQTARKQFKCYWHRMATCSVCRGRSQPTAQQRKNRTLPIFQRSRRAAKSALAHSLEPL
jgi:hypothetical protein